MALTLRVTVKDAPAKECVVTPRIEVAFEDNFDIPLSEFSRQKHLYWIAWKAYAAAGGVVPILYDDWLDQIVDVEIVDTAPKEAAGDSASA